MGCGCNNRHPNSPGAPNAPALARDMRTIPTVPLSVSQEVFDMRRNACETCAFNSKNVKRNIISATSSGNLEKCTKNKAFLVLILPNRMMGCPIGKFPRIS